MSGELTAPVYRSADLVAFGARCSRRAGLDPDKAATVAEVLVEGDLLGHTTHGLALAPLERQHGACRCARSGLRSRRRGVQALAAGLSLYPGIRPALEPWAEKLGVAPPPPRG
jgi:LDH2 family malate/lactate/ureidoglycolate dehydrogenase